jgi:hypothetical protein
MSSFNVICWNMETLFRPPADAEIAALDAVRAPR